MAKVTFVIGLCGSGKTFLTERLVAGGGIELFESLVEKQATDIPRLLRSLTDGIDCVVEEISFCLDRNRDWIVHQIRQAAPKTQIEWMCYENDVDAANWNVTHRTNKGEADRHKEINGRVHLEYTCRFFIADDTSSQCQSCRLGEGNAATVVKAIRADKQRWVDFMMRFELGLEEPDPKRAGRSAFTIASSYIAGGLVPLAPYFFVHSVQTALIGSVVVTLLALLVFGYIKGQFTTSKPFRSAWQTVVVGGLAATAAFVIAEAIG